MNTIWNVPRTDQPSFLLKRLRSLAALILIALLFAANAVLPDLTGARTLGRARATSLVIVGAVIVDAAVFAVMFRLLTARPLTWGDVWVGARRRLGRLRRSCRTSARCTSTTWSRARRTRTARSPG